MLRYISLGVMLSLIAMQNVGKADDQGDLRTSLQACLNDALTAASFEKARMGTRGILVVHCSGESAQQMYATFARKVPARSVTFRNRDKGAELNFGLSTCTTVKEKADGTPSTEFSCRIGISVGAPLLESF